MPDTDRDSQWSVRRVHKEVLEEKLYCAAKAQLVTKTIRLWGEVVEVRGGGAGGLALRLRDKNNAGQGIKVTLPKGDVLPTYGDMVCVEGTLCISLDSRAGALSVRLDGAAILECTVSKRVQDQKRALANVAAHWGGPREVEGPLQRIAVVSSRESKGAADFDDGLRKRVWYGLKTERIDVRLGDKDSVERGLRKAGESADLIAVVRGGGPPEELEIFNDPAIAEALASLPVPVVLGVGHFDDKVAARRFVTHVANTPADAAQIVADLYYDNLPRLPALVRKEETVQAPISSNSAHAPVPADLVQAQPVRARVTCGPERGGQTAGMRFKRSVARFFRWIALFGVILCAGWLGCCYYWNKDNRALERSADPAPAASPPAASRSVTQTSKKEPGRLQKRLASQAPTSRGTAGAGIVSVAPDAEEGTTEKGSEAGKQRGAQR